MVAGRLASKVYQAGAGVAAQACPGGEGEAGTPVTVVSLPARGRPPQAAARRAGLDVPVEKVVTTLTCSHRLRPRPGLWLTERRTIV
jgi:hypothetical protein